MAMVIQQTVNFRQLVVPRKSIVASNISQRLNRFPEWLYLLKHVPYCLLLLVLLFRMTSGLLVGKLRYTSSVCGEWCYYG
jgi:hypothetical protein